MVSWTTPSEEVVVTPLFPHPATSAEAAAAAARAAARLRRLNMSIFIKLLILG
jgi:hypothetical protein